MKEGFSARSAAVVFVPALMVFLLPDLATLMIYDRSAIVAGEWWRLVTGHWVHFSVSHLIHDATVIAITAMLAESRGYRHFAVLCLISAVTISLVMLAALPELALYGGLSGIAMAGAVYVGLHGLNEAAPWRSICLSALLLSLGKLVFDLAAGHFAMVDMGNDSVVPVPLSHAAGAMCGLIAYLSAAWRQTRYRIASTR